MPDFKTTPTVYRTAVSLAGHIHPNSPDELPGLALWLKADNIPGLGDSAQVATWADSSGNGRDLTQGTAGSRPLYRTGILNGLPVVRFDGSDDWLERSFTAALVTAPLTLLMVAVLRGGAGSYRALVSAWEPSPQKGYAVFANDLNVWSFWSATTAPAWDVAGSATATIGTPVVVSVTLEAAAKAGFVSGAANGSSAVVYGPSTQYPWRVGGGSNEAGGGGFAFFGDIAEVVVFGRALTAAERIPLELSLGDKWGFAVAGTPPIQGFASTTKWGTD